MNVGQNISSEIAGNGVRDTLMPQGVGTWRFDSAVAACFPDMLNRSIPELASLRSITATVGGWFREQGGTILDLGASRGDAIYPFIERYGGANRYVLVERSPDMREVLAARLGALLPSGKVVIDPTDISTGFPVVDNVCLTLCIFTLQFIPRHLRFGLIKAIHKATVPGGALILAEKIAGETPELDAAFRVDYREFKRANGYTLEQIAAKERALEGVMSPLPMRENNLLLRSAGFGVVQPIWSALNFAAVVALKRTVVTAIGGINGA